MDPNFRYGLMQGGKKKRPAQVPSLQESVSSTNTLLDSLLSPEKTEDEDFELDTNSASMQATTSSNPSKPRTLQAGYDYKNQTLVVVFRDGTWWEYKGVPVEMWDGFKAAESKGKYLRSSGLDGWSNMGPADVSKMPTHRRVQMNGLTEWANRMYGNNNSDASPSKNT